MLCCVFMLSNKFRFGLEYIVLVCECCVMDGRMESSSEQRLLQIQLGDEAIPVNHTTDMGERQIGADFELSGWDVMIGLDITSTQLVA